PSRSPAAISISVHEKRPGQRVSIQSPARTPSRVGIAIDHPTIPYIPSPNHVPRSRWRSACLLRAARCAIRRASGSCGGSPSGPDTGFQLHKAADEVCFEARHRAAGVTLPFILREELPLDGEAQPVEVIPDYRAPRRHQHIRTVLDEEAPVHGCETLPPV